MQSLKPYTIVFGGLNSGVHGFEFSMENSFFEAFDRSEIKKASLRVWLELNKKPGMLTMDFLIHGTVVAECDLCLEEFSLPIEVKERIYVKFTDNPGEEEEDIIYLYPAENEINIAQHLYEFVHLALPLKRVHPLNEAGESLCNREMLLNIAQFSPGRLQDKERWKGLEEALRRKDK